MILLTEQNEKYIAETSTDSSSGKKDYYITGIFLEANMTNRNSRRYPLDVLIREVAKYNQAYVSTRRALSELGHPESPTVNLDRVSHIIEDLHQDGNSFIGKAKVLDTPFGKIIKTFIDEGIRGAVSSRGMGTLKEENGVYVVQDDFFLSAVDYVHDPSGIHCFVQGLREQKEWVWNNGILVEKVCESINKKLASPKKIDEKAMIEAFDRFMRSL